MKNSIPSDVWEKKRALIAKLYKDEEWPLKQVIKQIRSDDFNPSETQLRSRLKKWRVTKPSRQTRKKSHDSPSHDAAGDDSSQEGASPKVRGSTGSPAMKPPSTTTTTTLSAEDLHTTEPDWFNAYAQPALDEHSASGAWGGHSVLGHPDQNRHLSNSPSMVHQFSSGIHDPSHMSSPGVLIGQSSTMAPPFSVSNDTCLQSPPPNATSAAPVPWHVPQQWYSMPLETVTQQPHSYPFYPTPPLSSGPHDQDPSLSAIPHPQTTNRIYSPQPPHVAHIMPELLEDSKSWKHAMPVNYAPEAAGGHPGVERQGRPVESKPSASSKVHSQLQQPQYVQGQPHPVICAPIYPFPGQDGLIHKPPGIGF